MLVLSVRMFSKTCPWVAQGYLLLVMSDILYAVIIEKLVVPEVVQNGATNVTLDCIFSGHKDHFKLQWWFAGDGKDRSILVYEWTPLEAPKVSVVLKGRLNLTTGTFKDLRALRIIQVDPELSGEYACAVVNNGVQVRETQRMIVFSAEEDFDLTIKEDNRPRFNITCVAYGVYPQPELILEYDKQPIMQQVQRVWHMSSVLKYDVETQAQLVAPRCENLQVTCRLHLPHDVYTAIKKKLLSDGDRCSEANRFGPTKYIFTLIVPYLLTITN